MVFIAFLVAALAQDLDAADPAEARRAIEAAIRKGDEEALKTAAATSRGARLALAEVRAQKRFESNYPPELFITYEAKDRPTAEVVADLTKLLGRSIEMPQPPKESLTIGVNGATFLETVAALETALGRSIEIKPDSLAVQSWMMPRRGPLSYWRHSKVVVESYTDTREVLSARSTARLYFTHWIDGRCRAVGFGGIRITEAVTDTGESLVPDSPPDGRFYGDCSNYQQFGVNVTIKGPTTEAKKLVLLRGVQRFLFPEKPRFVDVSLAEESRTIEGNNLSLRVERSKDSETFPYRVQMKIGDWKKPHVRPIPADFQLVGKDGVVLPGFGAASGPADSAMILLSFRRPEGFQPDSVRIRLFDDIGEHDFPFEFRDLALR